MGVVYRARDLRLERLVALKFLPPHLSEEPAARDRFRIEAQAAAALDHPNICTIHEIGEAEDGLLFIAMPVYQGETLKARLARGPVPVDEALGLAIQAARGLAKAHEHGIVHRDIKPANLMVTGDGVLKILDFGVAKLAGMHLTTPGQRPGTVAYMSPEQALGEPLDGRTDVWSLGVVLYEAVAGDRPFRGTHELALMHAMLHEEPTPMRLRRREVPEGLDRVVARMLAKRPADRYTAAELLEALERLRRPSPTGSAGGAAPRVEEVPEVLPEGERRQAAVLAVTLADSERLLDALGFARMDALVGRFRAAADEVVRGHGGVINEFTPDGVVALFGVPATHEDDPARAVGAALELGGRAPELLDAAGGPQLRLRAGIHAGSVAVQPARGAGQEYRVAGSVVQAAVRLAGCAPAGEVWVTPDCRRAITRRFRTEAVGPVTISTDGPPVTPFRVVGPAEAAAGEFGERTGAPAFIGREREMAALRCSLEEAMAGEGRFVTITGETGVGKTRLLSEFGRELEGADVTVLRGRCDPHRSGAAYLPFVEVLREWLRAPEDDGKAPGPEALLDRLPERAPELGRYLPLYRQLLLPPDPERTVTQPLQGEEFRLAMQEALAGFVTVNAARRATVLVLEDWQWADDASHGVLEQLGELAAGFRLLVLVTCRTGETRGWGNPSRHLNLALEPLGPDALEAMLRSMLGVEAVPGTLVALVHERTAGNPFFVEEVARTLLEEDRLRVEAGQVVLAAAPDALQLPDTVQGVVRARLDRLDRTTREVMRVASVVGREFTRAVLDRVVDSERVARALQTLKAAGIVQQVRVVPEPSYRFKHALTHEAAYASLLEHQKKDLHGRVGAVIEAQYGAELHDHLDRLVEHFCRAENWPKAVHYALRSAERAGALSQFGEALELLERAQGWLPGIPAEPERRDLLLEILFRQERLCETLGLRDRQREIIDRLLEALEPSGDRARLAEAYLRDGDLNTLQRRFAEAETALERSLRLRREAGDRVGERNTLKSLGLLRWHQGRDEEALRCMEAALAIDRERGDLEAQVGNLVNLGNVLKATGDLGRARARLEEALGLSRELQGRDAGADLAITRSSLLHILANVHRELGDDDRALEYLSEASALATERGMPVQLSYHLTATAHIYFRRGRVDESLALYREAVELSRRARFVPGLAQTLRILGEVLLGLGRDQEALAPLSEAAELFAQLRDPSTEASLWREVAGLCERRGPAEDAVAAWRRARTRYADAGDPAAELEALEALGRLARHRLQDPALAAEWFGEAVPLAEALGDRRAAGRLRNALGVLAWERGRYEEARGHYQAAVRLFREIGDGTNTGLVLASLGVTLGALGRAAEAAACLDEARALHRSAGDRLGEARVLGARGDLELRLGRPDRAVALYEESLQIRRDAGDRAGEGWMLHHLARAHGAAGAPSRSAGCAAEAVRIARETGDAELGAACAELSRGSGD